MGQRRPQTRAIRVGARRPRIDRPAFLNAIPGDIGLCATEVHRSEAVSQYRLASRDGQDPARAPASAFTTRITHAIHSQLTRSPQLARFRYVAIGTKRPEIEGVSSGDADLDKSTLNDGDG